MSQQFCLKWNNHMSNMMDVFKNLLSTEAMVDVTLACDGLSLKAHKIVLSACSPFFQSLFLENPCKHPIVILKDMKYTELKAIIEFMYHGEVNVAQDQLSALMKTAETLRVKGLAEVTNEKNQSGDESSHRSVSRTDTPPPKRRRGRTRKRSMSDQSDDGASEPKIKQPDSDIEELSGDMDPSTPYSTASTVPLQSHSTNSFHKSQQEQQQPVEQGADESFAPEEKFGVEPSKLLEQTLTTDDLPRRSGRSSVQSNMELQRRPRSSTDHSSSIVPVTSTPMSSDALVVANQQPESPPDIKPELLDLEPPMSPVAGPSHSADENSMMMYMDQSSMSNMPGPSGYQDNSALVSTDSQPQEKGKVDFENKILKKICKNPELTVENSEKSSSKPSETKKPASSDDSAVVEMTFAVKTEPRDEEMESDPSSQTGSNLQDSAVTMKSFSLDCLVSSPKSSVSQANQVSISECNEEISKLQEAIDFKQNELEFAYEKIKFLEEELRKANVDPVTVLEAAEDMAIHALKETFTKMSENKERKKKVKTDIKNITETSAKVSENKEKKLIKKPASENKNTQETDGANISVLATQTVTEFSEYHHVIPKPKTKSPVWIHFGLPADEMGRVVNTNVAICTICSKSVSSKGGSTTNLISHLKCHHLSKYRKMRAASNACNTVDIDNVQTGAKHEINEDVATANSKITLDFQPFDSKTCKVLLLKPFQNSL